MKSPSLAGGRVSLFDRLTGDRGLFCVGGASWSGDPVETGWGMISLSVEGSFSSAVITLGGNEPGLEGVFFTLVGELYISGILIVNGVPGGALVGSGSDWGVVRAGRWTSSCGVCRCIRGGSRSSSLCRFAGA